MIPDAADELFKAYYNDALLYVVSMTKDLSSAEDIVGTAFYRALATAGEIDSFKPWLLAVCRNEFLNSRRRSKREAPLGDDMSGTQDSIIDTIILDEEYRALHRAIAHLSEEHRELVLLYYFESLPSAEIAQILGKSDGSVRVGLYRARAELKKIMEGKYGF